MATWLGPPVEKYDYGTNGGSWTRQPALIVIHSTEGTGWTNYGNGASAPHFTLEPKSGEIHQHVSLSMAARALKNASGGVETNRGGAIQVEVIGTCDPSRKGDSGWNYLPAMDDRQAGHVRALLDLIAKATGIPLVTSVKFEPYPDPSYGSGYPRLSGSTWGSYRGVLGHQHVPENDHGDPGDIPIARILGSSGGEEMPSFIHLAIEQGGVGLAAQKWQYVTWDTVGGGAGSASDQVANPGSASIDIGGRNFAATLILGARIPTGATLETRLVYGDLSGSGGAYVVKDARIPAVLRGGGDAYILDTRNDGCPDGQKARYQVWASEAGQLLKADLTMLTWT